MRYATDHVSSLTESRSVSFKFLVILLVLILGTPRALAEPIPAEPVLELPTTHLVLKTGDGRLIGPNLKAYRVPQQSHVLTPDGWSALDKEMSRLQEAETRLTAENKSLRQSANEWPILPVAIGIGIGIVLGSYVAVKIKD